MRGFPRPQGRTELPGRHLDLALDGSTTRAATTTAPGSPPSFTDLLAAADRPSVED
ncbi:hypothetical protein [Streptomyces sp. SID3343]|uniref:hypothetical protein n=1 Tax=Streptomyces sp. SID3343 TaxID=2690260 RepID=UPI00136D8E37|nr:hypothetical protein [Streptomyces sp. SID3343]MYW04027.1 hypothetical protein [Streptomyces sp. SID3343]